MFLLLLALLIVGLTILSVAVAGFFWGLALRLFGCFNKRKLKWKRRSLYLCKVNNDRCGVVHTADFDRAEKKMIRWDRGYGTVIDPLSVRRPEVNPVYLFVGAEGVKLFEEICLRRRLYIRYREFVVPANYEGFWTRDPECFLKLTEEFEPKA